MKKIILILFVFVLTAINSFSQVLSFNDAIVRSARSIERALSHRSIVAVINFNSPTEAFSNYVIEELIGELLKGRNINLIDQRRIVIIMEEMNFKYSDNVNDESLISIGGTLGVQTVISGQLLDMNTFYRFIINITNIEEAQTKTLISLDIRNDTKIYKLLGKDTTKYNLFSANFSGVLNGFFPDMGFGVRARYERLISNNWSLGLNFDWSTSFQEDNQVLFNISLGNGFGPLFYRMGLGYVSYSGYEEIYEYYYQDTTNYPFNSNGLALVFEVGGRINFNKAGKYFFEFGLIGTYVFGEGIFIFDFDYENRTWKDFTLINTFSNLFVGMSYAF